MGEEVKYQTMEQRILWLWSKIHNIYREDFDIMRITEENVRTDMKVAYLLGRQDEKSRLSISRFQVGDKVKIIKLLDNITSHTLIGEVGAIREIDPLPNGEFNYYVDDHYMHEDELEKGE